MSSHNGHSPEDLLDFSHLETQAHKDEIASNQGTEVLGAAMLKMLQELRATVKKQKSKIEDFDHRFHEMQQAIMRVDGVDQDDPDLKIVSQNLKRFQANFSDVHSQWKSLEAQTVAAAHGAPTVVPQPHADPGHGHDAHGHGPARPTRAREELGEHKWQKPETRIETPVIDIPSLELEKIISTKTFMDAYVDIAKGNDQEARIKIKGLFDMLRHNDLDVNKLEEIIQPQGYDLFDFGELWEKKLWENIYETLKQTVNEDFAQAVEGRIDLLDKANISAPRAIQKALASGLVIGVGATVGAIPAAALGAGTAVIAGAAGVAGGLAHRTQTSWWERARNFYKNIGKEGEEKRQDATEKKKKKEILGELRVGSRLSLGSPEKIQQKVQEMASWISQALRDATAKKTIAEDKKIGIADEKTNLRERDDANLYLLRMEAAKHVRAELANNRDIAKSRTATLDQLTNGLNWGRDASGAAYVSNKNLYEKKAGLDKAVIAKAKSGELGTIQTVVGGATIGLASSFGLPILAEGGIAAVPGIGFGVNEAARHKEEVIKSGFEKNLKKMALEAGKIIAYIKKDRVNNSTLEPDDELMQHNNRLEAIIKAGAFHKNKPMELAARDALHEGRRNYELKHLIAEINGGEDAESSKEVVKQEVKRLTKKRFDWDKVKRVVKGAVMGVSLSFAVHGIANKAHESFNKQPVRGSDDSAEVVAGDTPPETKLPGASEEKIEREEVFSEDESEEPDDPVAEDTTVPNNSEVSVDKKIDSSEEEKKLSSDYKALLSEVKSEWDKILQLDSVEYLNSEAQAVSDELEKKLIEHGGVINTDVTNLVALAQKSETGHKSVIKSLATELRNSTGILSPEEQLLLARLGDPGFTEVTMDGFKVLADASNDKNHGLKIWVDNSHAVFLYNPKVNYHVQDGQLLQFYPDSKTSTPVKISVVGNNRLRVE